MNLHQLNVFAEASLANTIKVAIVRYLERLYALFCRSADPAEPSVLYRSS